MLEKGPELWFAGAWNDAIEADTIAKAATRSAVPVAGVTVACTARP
jgi:hypothetical protein